MQRLRKQERFVMNWFFDILIWLQLMTGHTITGGGWIVLGQRYLAGEKTSLLSTAFVGTLHQVSLWDVPVTANHMWNAAHNCTWPIAGSVRAWSSFLQGNKGRVEKRFITQCKGILKQCILLYLIIRGRARWPKSRAMKDHPSNKVERYYPLGIARSVPAIKFRSPSGCTKVFFPQNIFWDSKKISCDFSWMVLEKRENRKRQQA